MSSEGDNHRIPSERSHNMRALTEDEIVKLEMQDNRQVTAFQAQKLERDARKNWDQFYKRNKTNFFKDRHWTTSEFAELLGSDHLQGKTLLEVGCGVGNMLFPLLDETPTLRIYACDFSARAEDFVKEHPLYDATRVTAFVADVTVEGLVQNLKENQMDIVTLIFVLSAIHPEKLAQSVRNIFECTKGGGVVLFRDYAVNDMTQIRFKPGHKIAENFYMRQDGTRTYFFTVEVVEKLFREAGFETLECCYVHCRTVNKKEGVDAPRTFVQAKFRKAD